MNLGATEPGRTTPEPVPEPRGGVMKFAFANGARPLEGYTIKRGIGRGGFGEVYYATSDAGKEVALKLIRRNHEVEIRGVSQCLNLRHPNLLALYDIRQDHEGDTWIVMEYVGGDSLEDTLVRNSGGLPETEALRWFRGIASGVAYLHDRGIVHRDLKPANIFSDEGCVKIGDYGLSKFISASRRSGHTESVGTVHYMAPEVANGRYGKEIDVYALGVMLYELLTGDVPFDGESVGEVLMKHLTAQPDLTRVPPRYRNLIARTLEKDPEKRLASVRELLAALDGAPVASPAGFAETQVHAPASASPAGGTPSPGPAPAWTPVGAPLVLPALPEEPLARMLRDTWSQLLTAWREAELNTAIRTVIIVCGLIFFFSTLGFWIPCGILYALYYAGRAIWLTWFHDPTSGGGHGAAGVTGPRSPPAVAPVVPAPAPIPTEALAGTPPLSPRQLRRQARDARRAARHAARHAHRCSLERAPREIPLDVLPLKSTLDQVTDLLGALLLAALTAVATAIVLANVYDDSDQRWNAYFWLAAVAGLGSWALLIAGKFWERHAGEPIVRRGILLAIGLGLGLSAWALDRMLLVNLSGDARLAVQPGLFSGFSDAYGRPSVTDYLAYFGFLFPVLRWWRLTDPLRRRRLHLGLVVMPMLWGWVLSWFWPFPQPWGFLAAGTTALATQLASPWFDRRELHAHPAA